MRVSLSTFPFITPCRGAITLVALTLSLLATGCFHRTIDPKYQPSHAPELAQLDPVTVRLEVIDQRPSVERENIGRDGTIVFFPKQDPPKTLFDAIKAGLQTNGHRVEENPNIPADVVLNVEMTRFYYTMKSVGVGFQKLCTVEANVTARRIKGDPRERRFLINGTNQTTYIGAAPRAATKFVASALGEAIDQLLNDQRLLEVLKSP